MGKSVVQHKFSKLFPYFLFKSFFAFHSEKDAHVYHGEVSGTTKSSKLFPYFSLFKSFLRSIVRKMHRFFMGTLGFVAKLIRNVLENFLVSILPPLVTFPYVESNAISNTWKMFRGCCMCSLMCILHP
ncbi:E3 ubiquitin-protein ligase UPL1-like [Iris pallida]|uniref:E3 ubiquitin-protein ligase UPL1-like n=1 Tax=Iris pallida TaxID=29817 RepID=A0AAX6I621_IRIPA|nr:E3 ubiquitin-protein ligase UPL1-like [Iris pallida]